MLNRIQYFVREHVGLMKLSDTYDILDPATQTQLGQAREEVGTVNKMMRLLVSKRLMPTRISIYEGPGEKPEKLVFYLRRGLAFLRPTVVIHSANGEIVGRLKSKLFSLGGAFQVLMADGTEVAQVKGNWRGWEFRFLCGDRELGTVSKKWAGLGKEMFTSADNYLITINDTPSEQLNLLLLAAGLSIDMVLKER